MAEYINRMAVWETACRGCTRHGDELGECFESEPCERLLAAFGMALAADVVPVVRCKDCRHWAKKNFQAGNDVKHLEYGGRCPYVMGARYESDFCSRGEQKEADGNGI